MLVIHVDTCLRFILSGVNCQMSLHCSALPHMETGGLWPILMAKGVAA